MLQDLKNGRTLEIDALPGAVKELGQLVGVATPVIDLVLALAQQRARVAGCYQAVFALKYPVYARIHHSITTEQRSRGGVMPG